MIKLSFPLIVNRLVDAIKRHNAWVEEVKAFFSRGTGERSWSLLLQLEGLGSTDAFNCVEMDMVVFEVQRVKEWNWRGGAIIGIKVGDDSMLLDGLSQILSTLDRSLYVHNKPDGCNQRNVCMFCLNESRYQEVSTCSVCLDCYHMQCINPASGASHAASHMCPYCNNIESCKHQIYIIPYITHELRPLLRMLAGSSASEFDILKILDERKESQKDNDPPISLAARRQAVKHIKIAYNKELLIG